MKNSIPFKENNVHQKYMKSIGSELFASLQKMEVKFKTHLRSFTDASFEYILSKIKSMLDAYEIISFGT